MPDARIIVWDLETVPDLEAAARLHDMVGATDEETRAAIGPKFQKHPLHKIACIGALVARRDADGWHIEAIGAPNLSERDEGQLISDFIHRIGELRAQLISFNGHRFDLPVLRYRAMVHRLSAPELHARPYFHRFSEDATDLFDVLGSFGGAATTLDATLKVMGLSGKPEGVDGSQVDSLVSEGRIQEVSWYCETDVLGTYRLWLLYELFRGALTREQYDSSESDVAACAKVRSSANPFLRDDYIPPSVPPRAIESDDTTEGAESVEDDD